MDSPTVSSASQQLNVTQHSENCIHEMSPELVKTGTVLGQATEIMNTVSTVINIASFLVGSKALRSKSKTNTTEQ